MKKYIILPLLLLGFSVYLIHRFIFASTFNWTTYIHPSFPFRFTYPGTWEKCEANSEAYGPRIAFVDTLSGPKITDKNSKYVFYSAVTCENFLNVGASYIMYSDVLEKTDDSDIQKWLIEFSRSDYFTPPGQIPATSGEHWRFISYAPNLIPGLDKKAAAKVAGFGDAEKYVFINDGKIYQVEFNPMSGLGSIPLKFINFRLKLL